MACIPAPEPAKTGGVSRKWSGTSTGRCRHGKTVVAMHRARWLSQRLADKPGKKVLFTTFTRNLAADIRANLQRLCSVKRWRVLKLLTLMPG
jgi:hypothetical protein